MIKQLTATCLALTLSSSVYAKDFSISERILGLEVGGGFIQADTNMERDHDGSDIEYGIRLGAQMDEWRTLFILSYFDSSDDDQNYEKGVVTFDYMFMVDDQNPKQFQPYIGLNVGYMNYESTYIDESGLLYGGQLGFTYRATEKFGLDVSYRYSLTDFDRTDHIQSIMVGFDYIY